MQINVMYESRANISKYWFFDRKGNRTGIAEWELGWSEEDDLVEIYTSEGMSLKDACAKAKEDIERMYGN